MYGNVLQGTNPYARNSGSAFSSRLGTYVPGMNDNNAPGVETPSAQVVSNVPVVGFLYSVSRYGIGEFWPLHLGTNTIGRSSDNDIVLHEMSVSEHHASISVKQMKSTGKLIASIRDVGSKNGMFLNDEELDYDNHPCKNTDLITIGNNYQLLLLLINAEEYGLKVAENFVADSEVGLDVPPEIPTQEVGDSTHGSFSPYDAHNRNIDTGTVDLSGAQMDTPGGTNYM